MRVLCEVFDHVFPSGKYLRLSPCLQGTFQLVLASEEFWWASGLLALQGLQFCQSGSTLPEFSFLVQGQYSVDGYLFMHACIFKQSWARISDE